ncbi:hypothetical protein BDB00DRAFT_473678 [Zychaea mexicana]|uniref:uncharacterized protein n=1 Tax=Zychaea mexicana TaxID=64656 RepID=UPI0022FE791C|nr:uncharacterized protein BDB00DRAFT_473678 [Zychaea mexicana]KAI9491818.1 hypothetical protein BDB00DRAFT_473678 [Zychaea mexicana]
MSSPTETEMRAARMGSRSFSLPFVDTILQNRRRKSSQSQLDGELQRQQRSPFVSVHPAASIRSSIMGGGGGGSGMNIENDEWFNGQEDNVEADVLFPQYEGDMQDKADMAAFGEMVDRRTSNDASTVKLSRTLSKRSRSYGDPHAMYGVVDPEAYRYHIYASGKSEAPTQRLQQLLTEEGRKLLDVALKTSGWWVDVLSPTDEEMKTISKTFHIHPLTAEDVLAQEPREKMELFPNYTFITFRSFQIDPYTEQILPFNFYILIFKQGLLTFHFKASNIPERVRDRTDQLKSNMTITPDWMNYALIDAVTDEFAPTILQVEMEAVSIDELSLVLRRSEQADMLRRISRCRRRSTQLSRLLASKLDVLKSLMKRYEDWATGDDDLSDDPLTAEGRKAFSDVCLYLGDIQDHVVTMVQNISHYNRILGRAHTNYLAQVNVELTQTYSLTNMVMNRLTFLATVFVPLTVVGGLFGMNVKVPGQDYLDLSYYFWILTGFALYIIATAYFGKYIGML